jgi:pyruvate/2-oxoglutarate dehydrogenase complex dihydrolipoamide dehydrogenase (E3) component
MSEEADVIVLGMGPGGENVAETLASSGLSVAGVEANLVGGECPYWGCVPSKMMIRAAGALAEARRVADLAGTADVSPDWSKVAQRIRNEATDDWNDKVAADRFVDKGGRLYRGHGRLISPDVVQVDDVRIRARKAVVIATGGAAAIPPIEGLDGVDYWTNHEAIECEELPRSLLVLGGGTIGAELAQVFARFGVDVTVVESGQRLLAREEPESSAVVAGAFAADGITVLTGHRAVRVHGGGGEITVTLDDGRTVSAERLLVAVGRRNDLTQLGVECIDQDPTARALRVDGDCRVAPGVYAVGDVTSDGGFTHVSMYQSNIVIADILGRPHAPARYHALPRVTFTDPEVGSVGLTEAQARERLDDVRVGAVSMASVARGWIHKTGNDGVIKVIADGEHRVLVGATAAGPNGGEVLGFLALAVQERIPVDHLRSMMYAYPTFHRGIEAALADLDV